MVAVGGAMEIVQAGGNSEDIAICDILEYENL